MTQSILANEPQLRLITFLLVFTLVATWEAILPRRPLTTPRARRWPSNLAIAALNTLLQRLMLPAALVGFALVVEAAHWGLLNQLALPGWLAFAIALLLLDLAIYLQHVLFHAVPVLWRIHRMHHADVDFDVTTGARFHPVEILLSTGIKLAVIAALGPPIIAVVAFELILSTTALFNHGNIRIAPRLDRYLRWLVVTPDMHRVHHSIVTRETNTNFGFNVPWWDRVFGTYRAQPAAGHDAMTIGIAQFRQPEESRLDRLLTQPFRDGEDSD